VQIVCNLFSNCTIFLFYLFFLFVFFLIFDYPKIYIMLLKPKEKLKFARKSKFTQAEFSELIAMDTSQYNRREKGRIPISDDEWLRFAKALNMNVNEIIETDTPLISITHNHEENDHTITNYEIKISLPKNIFDLFNAKFDAVIELLRKENKE
jgi:hypothetical protein